MRFATLSAFILALALGHTSAQDLAGPNDPRASYDQECGIPGVSDANLDDCDKLLKNQEIWNDAIAAPETELQSINNQVACYGQCCIFQRLVIMPVLGVEHVDTIQEAALPLLGCAGSGGVNGRLTYGAADTTLYDRMRYYLCIAGGPEGRDYCFSDLAE